MIPQDALTELLECLGAARDGKVNLDEAELREWPSEAVAAMKQQKLLGRARPAKSVVCPGCERQCFMPVHHRAHANWETSSFVVCDKRDDINQVPIAADLLKQWRCDAEGVCDFIATSLNIHRSQAQPANESIKVIGMVRGNEQRQTLCLRAGGQVSIVAGNKSQPLMELIDFDSRKFNVDAKLVRGLVDSATTTDSTYTPRVDRLEERKLETQAMYEDWRRAYRELKKQRPHMSDSWHAGQIAKMDIARRRDAETIRKHLKK